MADEWQAVRPGTAIYQHIIENVSPHGSLAPDGLTLPDDARVTSQGVHWAPGAKDGVFSHHFGGGDDSARERARAVADLVAAAARDASAESLGGLYDAVSDDDVLLIVDQLGELLAASGVSAGAVHRVGRWLATSAADRGAVKLGIALIGMTGLGPDADVVRMLGRHDEFTLYAAVALANGTPDPEAELWALARLVDGWGRIHCVERLADTEDHAIREWILRAGFRNSVANEYLAYTAATTGRLSEALRRDDIDRQLLTSAGEIIEALVAGGPARDMDDYSDGADMVEAYLSLMDTRAQTLGDYMAVAAIGKFLGQPDGWDDRARSGWTATRREAFEAHCAAILGSPAWADRIRVALLSDDLAEFWRADTVAAERGIDTFDAVVAKIRADPFGTAWYRAWEQAGDGRAEMLASLAGELLPLGEIATGPADETGMGPQWRPHLALTWTLQALGEHPGVGADLVLAGLRSPVVSNRNFALRALRDWPQQAWPDGARELAGQLAAADPQEKTRALAAEILGAAAAG